MKKRILSLALCIVMVLGLFPTAAFAAEQSAGLANFVKTRTFTSGTFTDVLPKHWFYDNVETAYEYGLMVGNSATTFNPTGNVTIAETITVAARLHSIYHTGKDDFAASKPWYQTYVDYALEHSIIPAAYSSYTVAATRSQYAAILAAALPAEALQEINQVADGDIPDVRLSDVYGKAVYTLYRAGILTGSDDKGTFNPKSNIQRCEVAAIVSRMADVSLRKSVQSGDEGTISMADGQKMTNLVKEIGKLTDNGATQKDIKTYLEGVDWIKVVAETEDGGVSCRTEFGVTGVWTPEQPGRISSSAHTTTRATAQSLIDEIIDKLENYTYEIDSIVILCPYASEDSDFILDGYTYLANAISEYSDCTVTVIRDQAVNLELLKTLDRFDMVWFYSHGALSNITNSAWAILDSDPYTMTGEFADSAGDYVLWSEDFFYGRTVINLNTGRIGVGGPFYEYYYRENQMNGTFFHFGSCNSMRTTKLASGLLSRGAAWVQGWTDSVWFENDYAHLLGVVDCLLRGMEVQEAIDQATEYAQQKYSHYFQKDCQLVGLGNGYYRLDPSDLYRNSVTFKFVDATTGGELETSSVEQTCIDFSGDFKADLSDYHFMYIIKNGTGVSGYTQELHLGSYRMTFSAPGYEDATVDFTVNQDLKEVVVAMTPVGSTNPDPIPKPETGHSVTGSFVYLDQFNRQIPVSFAKCSFIDVDNSNNIYFAEVYNGTLSNTAFVDKPIAGTYRFELSGGEGDADGFYSVKTIDYVTITGSLDMGTVICDRVAEVTCAVADTTGVPFNHLSMQILQNGVPVAEIPDFYFSFTTSLKKGTYQMIVSKNGYTDAVVDFTVDGTIDLGTITLLERTGGSGSGSVLYSGECGDQVKWEIYGNTLRIYGTGAMETYLSTDMLPWHPYSGTIEHAIVDEGVTKISPLSFALMRKLKDVWVGSSVSVIGAHVFDQSTLLTSVVFKGNAPSIDRLGIYWDYKLFENRTLTAYYPRNNATWTADAQAGYGGGVTWIAQ